MGRICARSSPGHQHRSEMTDATSEKTHFEVKDKNSVISSIKNSGNILNTSGVSFGNGNLCNPDKNH